YRIVYLLPTWHYFLWNLMSQSPGVHDQGEASPPQYPELQTLAPLFPGLEAVLDGENITLDGDGRPSVERLQQRMSLRHRDAVAHAADDLPIQLMLYDTLYLGEPVVQLPYTARRDLLDDLTLTGPGIAVPAAWPSMVAESLEQSLLEGYDGVIAKRLTSSYLPGRRSRGWIKIRHQDAGD
ncbi:ATP-dependent DNA ligase, partial [Streptomyces mirabilis]